MFRLFPCSPNNLLLDRIISRVVYTCRGHAVSQGLSKLCKVDYELGARPNASPVICCEFEASDF